VRTQLFSCAQAGPRAPRCPLELSEQAGPNCPASDAVASPGGDLGIHTSGPPTIKKIAKAIDTQMQTTLSQSRSQTARTESIVQSRSRHVIRVARSPAGIRASKRARTGDAYGEIALFSA